MDITPMVKFQELKKKVIFVNAWHWYIPTIITYINTYRLYVYQVVFQRQELISNSALVHAGKYEAQDSLY